MSTVKRLQRAPGWRVITKFEAPAAFFIPYENGSGWNSTAGVDGGGKVSAQSVSTYTHLIETNFVLFPFHSQLLGTHPNPSALSVKTKR